MLGVTRHGGKIIRVYMVKLIFDRMKKVCGRIFSIEYDANRIYIYLSHILFKGGGGDIYN